MNETTTSPRTATKADAALGERIRDCRRALGVSQEELAGCIGVTFQQVQKYENGRNRVGAIRLLDIAACLKVHPATLLTGLHDESGPQGHAQDLVTGGRVKTALQGVNRAMAALVLARQSLIALQADYPPPDEAEVATHPKEFLDRKCRPVEEA